MLGIAICLVGTLCWDLFRFALVVCGSLLSLGCLAL